jgi:hypothetical protein
LNRFLTDLKFLLTEVLNRNNLSWSDRTMQIEIFYSKSNADHLKAVSFVREAVQNLGISATINEREVDMPTPRVMVNGFDLIGSFKREIGRNGHLNFSYEQVAKILEQTAWSAI